MSFENVNVYMEQGGSKLVVNSSGELQLEGSVDVESGSVVEVKSGGEIEVESGGRLVLEAGAKFVEPIETLSTGSTGSVVSPYGITYLSSTKTSKALTLSATAIGTNKTLYCTAATATGFVSVNVGSTSRTFDGTNYIYKFLKAGTWVTINLASTSRWYELVRSVADGTSIGSTST